MNKEILTTEVQEYIRANETADASSVALKKSPFALVSAKELAEQIDGRQRAKRKIPAWTDVPGILFPEKLNLEQCSSSSTGMYKAALIKDNSHLIDLTGGFGVDSYYFAKRAKALEHCEINAKLSAVAAHNFRALGLTNVRFHPGDGLAYLAETTETFDYIYSDPSRRVSQQKVFRLEDCEPNIIQQQSLFFSKAPVILTKLAPLLDIHLALNSLAHVKDVYVLSVDNDCKELLFVQHREYSGPVAIHAVRMQGESTQHFHFTYEEEQQALSVFIQPQTYLYDPDVAISKAGAFKSIGSRYNIGKLHKNTHLYTSTSHITDFPGRIFRIEKVWSVSAYKKQSEYRTANVIAKNFPLKVEDIRKKYKIKDGGNQYLYFTTLENGELAVVLAERIQ